MSREGGTGRHLKTAEVWKHPDHLALGPPRPSPGGGGTQAYYRRGGPIELKLFDKKDLQKRLLAYNWSGLEQTNPTAQNGIQRSP